MPKETIYQECLALWSILTAVVQDEENKIPMRLNDIIHNESQA